jgi:L-alanine-DL-glutamate epimerase-like enolase superfamily enzyme
MPWLQGRVVKHVPDTIVALYGVLLGAAQQSGTMGSMLAALCAVELALWDLAGQVEGKPLARLLFAESSESVRVYGSGINSPLPWALIDAHLEVGVRLFKLKLGFGEVEDRANLTALTNYLGERAQIAVDVNRGWTFAEAKRWLPILADFGVQWLEEPLRVDEETDLAELQSLSEIPLAGGENIQMPPNVDVEAWANAPFDILQPDITKYTPLHVAVALQARVEKMGKQMIPHILGSGPGQAASIQLAAGCAEAMVELDLNENRLRTAVCEQPFVIEDGRIALPENAGIGWGLKRGK